MPDEVRLANAELRFLSRHEKTGERNRDGHGAYRFADRSLTTDLVASLPLANFGKIQSDSLPLEEKSLFV